MTDDQCTCTRGPQYEGPEIDCPVHGDPAWSDAVATEPVDLYQQRYLLHQNRKAGTLAAILAARHSDRMFGPDDVSRDELDVISRCLLTSPTSCNRSGINLRLITDRDQRALLGGFLVGGVGWIHRAPAVFLMVAQHEAYKAPGELAYMPFLDAGCLLQSMWLTASELGLAAAYANPNIRPAHHGMFADTFLDTSGEGETFCGALAVGHRHPDSPDAAHAATRDRGVEGEPRVGFTERPMITGGSSPSILEPCKVTSSHAAHDWPEDAPIRHCPGIK